MTDESTHGGNEGGTQLLNFNETEYFCLNFKEENFPRWVAWLVSSTRKRWDLNLRLSEKSSLIVHAQSCATLCDPIDWSLRGSSVHRISQTGILEWAAISSSRGSSQPRDQTHVSCAGKWILYCWATWGAELIWYLDSIFWNKNNTVEAGLNHHRT